MSQENYSTEQSTLHSYIPGTPESDMLRNPTDLLRDKNNVSQLSTMLTSNQSNHKSFVAAEYTYVILYFKNFCERPTESLGHIQDIIGKITYCVNSFDRGC